MFASSIKNIKTVNHMQTLIKKLKVTPFEQLVTYVLGGICLCGAIVGVAIIIYYAVTGGFVDHNGSF